MSNCEVHPGLESDSNQFGDWDSHILRKPLTNAAKEGAAEHLFSLELSGLLVDLCRRPTHTGLVNTERQA